MSVKKDTAIMCDGGCGECAGWSRTALIARQEVRKMGWITLNGKDYCPQCSGLAERLDRLERRHRLSAKAIHERNVNAH